MSARKGKRSTITDVARLAGTSVTTVSRVLNNSKYPVSPQLRQRVKDAAAALDYVPNAMARSLRGSTIRDIGIVIPNITNPFYLQTILGINSVAYVNGYSLLLCNTMRQVDKEREYLRKLFERQVQGVILSSVDEDADIVREYIRKGMKFVLLDQRMENINCSCINFDSRKGARMAVKYLIDQGHRRIALATTPLTRWTRNEVYKGYRESLISSGLSYGDELLYVSGPEREDEGNDYELGSGKALAKKFIQNRKDATAVLCINDMVAFGFINALAMEGIRVPDDVSVIGFDDIPFAEAFLPPLTTIRYPSDETGRLAAMMLLDNIRNGGERLALDMSLVPRLIVRGTVKRIH
ncbi:MAG TPA: LacI family DNA-binding transcriptional regulator [Clostridia bacterium]|jgi:LacI family transcriptional regulator|nr:LacI family DNA-binding transcriptional regulator [Clostridia bacterium]